MDPVAIAEQINALQKQTFAGDLGIVVVSATRDSVTATLEVRPGHRQPQGIVHGGVYATFIESVASIGAALDAMPQGKNVVGLENHTSFVRAVREGTLHAVATPVTRGRRSQLWDVVIRNDEQAVAATGRVRLLVLDPEAQVAGTELSLKSE
ncbi:MAG: PaaI family thioesterase [Polyangiaceae bacterium]|nr:PaaI family thioesterase [Polyangiaceae bacterium]